MSKGTDIVIEFDESTRNYYVVWEPIVISSGRTQHEALEDLREASHFGVDTWIDLKLKDLGQGKED